jgi:dienelactone hydrolase
MDMRCAVLFWMIALATLQPAAADDYYQEELRIPMAAAGPHGLEALLIRPAGERPYPLALITHGTSSDAEKRHDWTPYVFYRQAIEFARRGFAALVVMRRGFGDSGGGYAERGGCCTPATYLRTAETSVDDLHAAIAAMQRRTDVTTQGMITIGVSSGGFATVALTSNPPPGLAAAINFAGGLHRAALPAGIHNVEDEDALVSAFGMLGKSSRTPMLWIYAENDSFFRPDLAHRLLAAFTTSGGRAQLIDAPAFGSDGHLLFLYGMPIWSTMIDDFLRQENLGSRDLLAPPALPALLPPPLAETGRVAFADYLASGQHKAFAVSPKGGFGFFAGTRSLSKAQNDALAVCARYAQDCTLYAIDNQLAGTRTTDRQR